MHISIFVFAEVELEDTRQENMTLRWQNGAISNFEYLMYLNRLVENKLLGGVKRSGCFLILLLEVFTSLLALFVAISSKLT